MKTEYNIALIGELSGCIETTLEVLVSRDFPVGKIFPLGNDDVEDQTVMYSGKPVLVEMIENFDWEPVDIAFFLCDKETSDKWADIAAKHCVVIDNSGAFLSYPEIPLVQAGVFDENIGQYTNCNKIAVPSSESAQLSLAIKQLHNEVGISKINIASYQSVSIAGKAGVTTLAGETARLLNGKPVETKLFSQQIAFNVIPQFEELDEDGIAKNELRLINEVRTLLNDPSINISVTQAIVPMFYGTSQAVHLETHYPVDLEEVANGLHHTDGIVLSKNVCDHPNMIDDVVGKDGVFVGRLRKDVCNANGINMWISADNVFYGIATNAISVAEKLIFSYL